MMFTSRRIFEQGRTGPAVYTGHGQVHPSAPLPKIGILRPYYSYYPLPTKLSFYSPMVY